MARVRPVETGLASENEIEIVCGREGGRAGVEGPYRSSRGSSPTGSRCSRGEAAGGARCQGGRRGRQVVTEPAHPRRRASTAHLPVGGEEVRALDGVSFDMRARRVGGHRGPVGLGQVHAHEPARLPRHAHRRRLPPRTAPTCEGLSDDALADLRNHEIGFVFQTFQLLPRATALANVELPLVYRGDPAQRARGHGRSRRSRRWGSRTACTTAPTSSPAASASGWPSPGRWWATPSLLLADEPTGNLDSATGEEIIRLFGELHAPGPHHPARHPRAAARGPLPARHPALRRPRGRRRAGRRGGRPGRAAGAAGMSPVRRAAHEAASGSPGRARWRACASPSARWPAPGCAPSSPRWASSSASRR